jgi:hypothetical protein
MEQSALLGSLGALAVGDAQRQVIFSLERHSASLH